MILQLQQGRPADIEKRIEKEIRVYDLLDSLAISYERVDHDAADTMEACAEIDKVLAPAEYMEKYLDITPGSVSVLGLMNDKNNDVQLLMDEDVLRAEMFGCHPCINTSSLRLKTSDVFENFLQAVGHDYMTVTLGMEDV